MAEPSRLYDLIKESFLLLDFGDRCFFEQYDLTVSRYYALHHIASKPGLTPTQLSHFMFCDKSNITRLLQNLETDGYLERRAHERDRRAQCLYLTSAGACLESTVSEAHQLYISERLDGVDGDASDQAEGVLTCLNRSLAESLQRPPLTVGD